MGCAHLLVPFLVPVFYRPAGIKGVAEQNASHEQRSHSPDGNDRCQDFPQHGEAARKRGLNFCPALG